MTTDLFSTLLDRVFGDGARIGMDRLAQTIKRRTQFGILYTAHHRFDAVASRRWTKRTCLGLRRRFDQSLNNFDRRDGRIAEIGVHTVLQNLSFVLDFQSGRAVNADNQRSSRISISRSLRPSYSLRHRHFCEPLAGDFPPVPYDIAARKAPSPQCWIHQTIEMRGKRLKDTLVFSAVSQC